MRRIVGCHATALTLPRTCAQAADGSWIDKIPAWIKFAVQAPGEIPFNGVYYDPPEEDRHQFVHPRPPIPSVRVRRRQRAPAGLL